MKSYEAFTLVLSSMVKYHKAKKRHARRLLGINRLSRRKKEKHNHNAIDIGRTRALTD